MDPSLVINFYYILGASVAIGGTYIPWFQKNVMNYGRIGPPKQGDPIHSEDSLMSWLRPLILYRIPHSWFIHYYVISVLSSIFWGIQIFTQGQILRFIAYYSAKPTTMTGNQIVLAWSLMAIQGFRRLYECLILTKPSQSSMWIGLWLAGIGYYLCMGISVWIEGTLLIKERIPNLLQVSMPSLKTCIAIAVFMIASGIQYDCHVYLASLKKYTLPNRGLFRSIICPHYTMECLIYISIAIISAPPDQYMNHSVLVGLIFVVTNLAITADASLKWSIERFGREKMGRRWRMVPYVY
ncbi:3-oxo-5-alpha-steroid 4-dehydrogenase-like protein [Xylogone sp. PMI_703]|nr:3-oxo-5-alpha-steroid 4-dehydrogenase-like protein [Xylogone sp. PMI_703]